jgi:hypothetical protein
MALCEYCSKPAGFGKVFHPDCKKAAMDAPQPPPASAQPLTTEQIHARELVARLEPALKRAVYRGVLLAMLTMTGIWIVLGMIVGILRSM